MKCVTNFIISHTADGITNYQPATNSTEIGKFCGNGQIPCLGSKYHGPGKTVALTYNLGLLNNDGMHKAHL